MASCLKISFVNRNGKNITIPVNKDSHVTGVITILVKNGLEFHKPEMNNV